MERVGERGGCEGVILFIQSYFPCVSTIIGHKESRVGVIAHRPKRTYQNRKTILGHRAGGAGPVAHAMAGPIFGTFQGFLSGHMLVQAGNMRICRPQAKCRRCQTNVA